MVPDSIPKKKNHKLHTTTLKQLFFRNAPAPRNFLLPISPKKVNKYIQLEVPNRHTHSSLYGTPRFPAQFEDLFSLIFPSAPSSHTASTMSLAVAQNGRTCNTAVSASSAVP